MILIADAHISIRNNDTDEFFQMLDAISRTDHDLIFLGDIFELWIALPRYEHDMHLKFLEWCKTEKANRVIGYVEGNHEFFLKEENAECFTWISSGHWIDQETQTFFAHGDLVNKNDASYRRFRKITKNGVTKMLAQYMPFAPYFINYLKRKLTNKNKKRGYIPKEILQEFADATFSDTVTSIVLGHFHHEFHIQSGDNNLYALPDWMATKKVTIYNDTIKDQYNCHWSEITGSLREEL